jgi:hypothetical protein
MNQLTEMVEPAARPVDDREGHLNFEPFTLKEWIVTILLALICFGIPIGAVIHYRCEMARLDAVALQERGESCVSIYRHRSFPNRSGMPGSAGGSTTSRSAVSKGQGGE